MVLIGIGAGGADFEGQHPGREFGRLGEGGGTENEQLAAKPGEFTADDESVEQAEGPIGDGYDRAGVEGGLRVGWIGDEGLNSRGLQDGI